MEEQKFSDLRAKLRKKTKASPEVLEEFISSLNRSLPEDYVSFLRDCDGAEGSIGNSYIQLWSSGDIIARNKEYKVEEFAPGLLIFASDGGDRAFAFDLRFDPVIIVEIPFIGMSIESIVRCGSTFSEFLQYLAVSN